MKYYEVKFNIQPYSDDAADIVAAIAGEAGFESFDTADGTLTGYVQQPLFDEPLLRQLLDTCPLPDVTVTYTVGEAEDRDWNEQWEQEGFEPIFVEERGTRDEERGARSEERGILIHDGRHLPKDYSPSSFFAEQSGRAERLVPPSSNLLLRSDRTSTYSRPGVQLVVPYGFIAADVALQPAVRPLPDAPSDGYQFTGFSTPLMADAPLSIFVRRPVADPTKLFLTDEQGRYLGGDYHDGWLTGHIRDLAGVHHLAYDAEPPAVRPLSLTGDVLRLSVTDGGSGIAVWTATVDDRFIVFDALEKSSTFACVLHESWLRPTGRQHRLRFEVTDNRQNGTVYETTFTY